MASEPTAEGLASRSVRGAAWVMAGQLASEPVRILITALLARALSPEQFGLVGMATVVTGLIAVANDFGLQAAIIQRREITKDELDSVFWFNLGVGVVLCLAGVALAPVAAAFFHEPKVTPVLMALSAAFVLSSLGQVQQAILRRDMDFKTPAIANIVAVFASGIVAVGLALSGAGVWALVANVLVASAASPVVVALKTGYLPAAHFRWDSVRGFAVFGGTITLAEFANYASANADNLLVGRVLGAGPLGAYSLAYNLVTYPVRRIAQTITSVAMPAFSRIQDESERYARALSRAMEMSGLSVLPFLAAAAVAGQSVILGVYGPKWSAAITPFRILCVVGMVRAFGVVAEVGLQGSGKARRYLGWAMVWLVALVFGVVNGLPRGIVGVAVGVASASGLVTLAEVVDSWRLIGPPLRELPPVFARGLVAAATSAACAWASLLLTGRLHLPQLAVAGIAVLAGVAVTWFALRRVPGFGSIRSVEKLMGDALRRSR